MRFNNKFFISVITIILLLIFQEKFNKLEFPEYRVMLDPGHGGKAYGNKSKHGDRYDVLSQKYLAHFDYGVRYKNLEEHAIVYSIALKVKNILDLSLPGGDFVKFKNIINRFTDENPGRIIIKSKLSRIDSRIKISGADPNGPFRLYDYPGAGGQMLYGRISRINAFKPHLVVSLHLDYRPPAHFQGINPVITAPYSLLEKGLKYLKGEIKDKAFFYKSGYTDWFIESTKRTDFRWFLKDVSVYFTGYPVDNFIKMVPEGFSGYRNNMVMWKYRDLPGWEIPAFNHSSGTRYSLNYNDISLQGRFWDRERSHYEKFRREEGEEGFGGDNLYACREIIRYILFSLDLKKIRHHTQKLGNPYISVWSVPLLVNAVAAFIELGYLYKNPDRLILTKKQDEIAEGIAVGIYSLLAGLKPKEAKFKYPPKGKRVDLEKYLINSEKDYFNDVLQ